MPTNIALKGNPESAEYKAALVLKSIFERDLPKDVNGEVLIYTNATLFGQDTRDIDIIVVGKFEKYSLNLQSKARYKKGAEDCEDVIKNRQVFINNFCFVIELKQQDARNLWLDGPELFVKYKDKKHSVTGQSEKQRYALKDFFNERLKISPHVYNFIWLRNVNQISIQQLVSGRGTNTPLKHNYLPTNFSLGHLFELAIIQRPPWTADPSRNYASFDSFVRKPFDTVDTKDIDAIFEFFRIVKKGMGDMTRKKVARITQAFLKDQNYAKAIGEKLVIIQGRAGTGKTIKLLNIACDLAMRKGARCLILTFNKALVGDIKRMIALAEIPDKPDGYSVDIKTMDSFFCDVLKGFKIGVVTEGKATYVKEYLPNREHYLDELCDYLDQGVINDTDIKDLMKDNHDAIAWDYILIDEGQDWNEKEKKIIFSIFGFKNVIVADGVDQLVRTQKKCIWSKDLKMNVDFEQTHEKKGLRQEVNLVNFVNYFAKKVNVGWAVEPKDDLIGGKIIVSLKPYTKALHEEQFQRVRESGNTAYEMLLLVPPRLIDIELVDDQYTKGKKKNKYFIDRKRFEVEGINIWDGTGENLRSEYVVDLNQHRLLQYDSCRGLEGWCVVCLDFDDFVKYKWETFKKEEAVGQLGLDTTTEDRKRFVNLWSLIPFTRAIDTLVITIRDKESEICKVLKAIHEEHPDYVDWIE